MFKFNWFKARSSTKAVAVASKNVEPSTFEISAIPDSAHGFGRKIVWFAVNSPDHNEVASVLGLSNVKPANWNSGLTIAYDNTNSTEYEHHAFLTPSIDGWVFILSPHFIEMTGQITEDPSQDIQSGFNHLF